MLIRPAVVALACLVLLPACREAKVASYRVPKEQPEPLPPILTGGVSMPAANSPDMAATAVPTAAGEGLSWSAPTHWKPKPASAMRKGSFSVPGDNGAEADLSITAFPGQVGGELANINRWRGQIQLPPISEADLPASTTRVTQGGLNFVIVDFASSGGEKSQRILGALVPFDGSTWFFKLSGPDALVAHEKPAFLDFLKTVKPATAASSPQ
jgi:hypothetical protein